MTVLYPRWTNKLGPALAISALVGLIGCVAIVDRYFSPAYTDVGYAPEQPVLYSHKLHAGLLGMDCRYCHQKVEIGPHATLPATETCINCHASNRVKGDSPRLAKIRESYETGKPVPWIKVHMLPDYAYFDHSAHLHAGIGCASCHGRIDRMEVVHQAEPLSMGWCLECHRAPERHLRPRSEITNMDYLFAAAFSRPAFAADVAALEHPEAREAEALRTGLRLKKEHHINPPTHCSACHR